MPTFLYSFDQIHIIDNSLLVMTVILHKIFNSDSSCKDLKKIFFIKVKFDPVVDNPAKVTQTNIKVKQTTKISDILPIILFYLAWDALGLHKQVTNLNFLS